MDNILYFAKTSRETEEFFQGLLERLCFYDIPYRTLYRNGIVETEDYKIYAVSASGGLVGALPGFRYYLNETTEEEFNKRARFKLLDGEKELKTFNELIELLRN